MFACINKHVVFRMYLLLDAAIHIYLNKRHVSPNAQVLIRSIIFKTKMHLAVPHRHLSYYKTYSSQGS